MMKKSLISILVMLILFTLLTGSYLDAQAVVSADVAAYQLGLIAETLPGSDLTYTITVTNYGPSIVDSFYILDGWTVNDDGIAAFTAPIAEPDFGDFALIGKWQQTREDQELLAWLLQGELFPGDTLQFEWIVQVDSAYQGVLVNWVSILTDGELKGEWQTRIPSTAILPPRIESATDSNLENNRTSDGVTIVTNTPTGKGIDLALYQTGVLSELSPNQPLESTWLLANLGPQAVNQFYIVAGGSLNSDGNTLLEQPIVEPDFADFQVLGRWQQSHADEELWLWLLQGELPPGESVLFQWDRKLIQGYRGDLITWAGVSGHNVPAGEWMGLDNTSTSPQILDNQADSFPENDIAIEALTTIKE